MNAKEVSNELVTKNVKLRCHQFLSPFLLLKNVIGDAVEDIDECRTGTPCGDLMCVNTVGSYECICPNGFTHDDGLSCRDIDECTETNNCGFYGCSNFPGGYICECPVNSLWNPFRIVFCSTLVILQLMQCYPDPNVILQLQCNLWSDEKTCKSIL